MITLTLDAPGKNALSTDLMESILDRLEKAGNEPVMFIGANGAFSAGLNLKEVATHEGNDMFAFLELLERCMTAIYLYPGPTVACVNGHAIAGGGVITICCDHRVVIDDPKVRVGLNEVALGVRFPPRIFEIVRRRVGALDRVVLGGELFDPSGALAVGLVDEIAANVEDVARARLATLAKHPRDGYAVTKRDLRGTEDDLCRDSEHALRLRQMVPQWTSPTVKDRIAAILKR
jgi:enoyl-CoA hydratase/carnithine racemase